MAGIFLMGIEQKMQTNLTWIQDYGFLAKSESGHAILMDAPVASGGNNLGPSPMEMVLLGAAGCMTYDVVHILKKSRCAIEKCQVKVVAEQASEPPKIFTKISFHFILSGQLNAKQVQTAINLSAEKYCSVSIMLGKSAQIDYSFEIQNLPDGLQNSISQK